MPLSSAEIAQLNGAFSQQNMMRMQYSGMISPEYNFGGINHRAGQEGLAARGLNTGMALGAPAASLGLGLMGLDPISMGMRAGGTAMGGGFGMAGGAMAGMAVGGGAMLGMAGVSYMANQVSAGMQQTQQFNNSMRGSYSFFNPHSDTGRGFSGGDIRGIGDNIRTMAGSHIGGGMGGDMNQFQSGPGFNELGRLAANMGRMGLADGVRNAKEFNEKFRDMIKTVTTIATEMGTTLEEAQKAMASMKGSGIFKNQGGVSGAIRNASIAGGLATTEVTGMMNVGSQIGRMYGGTGRQGAMGGINAISQVGSAVQVGALSEEDIYNATGQTGAEGRRAMASQQLMQTGEFLKSGKGRYLLASLAGKNGNLDSDSVANFMSGGMSVDDTRGAAHKNLAKVGRANFIRNEGRLRGSVMEEFGGLAPAMAMMGWAQGKGIDINSMGDREMLFMQRQMGMGRDEADSLVKMARMMPELLQSLRNAKEDDAGMQEHLLRAQGSGIEGIKRKLEAARDNVNNEMQKAGQAILNSATDAIASWGNRLADTYEEHSIEGIRETQRTAMMGGKQGRAAMNDLFGSGKAFGGGAGIGLGQHADIGQVAYRNHQQDMQFAARIATTGSMDSNALKLVNENSSVLKRAYAESSGGVDALSGLGGDDRVAGFKRKFGTGTALGRHFRSLDQRGQVAFLQQAEGVIGIQNGRMSESYETPGLPGLVGGSGARTEAERQEAVGRQLLGLKSVNGAEGTGGTLGHKTLGKYNGEASFFGEYDGKLKIPDWMPGFLGGGKEYKFGGQAKAARAAGAIFDSADMRKVSFDVLSGAEGAQDRMYSMISEIRGGAVKDQRELSLDENAKISGLGAIQIAADVNKLISAKGGAEKLSETDWDSLIEKRKQQVASVHGDPNTVTKQSIKDLAGSVGTMAEQQRREITNKVTEQIGKSSRSTAESLQIGGIARLVNDKIDTTGLSADSAGYLKKLAAQSGASTEHLELTDSARKKLMASGGKGALQAAQHALAADTIGLQLASATTDAQKVGLGKRYDSAEGDLYDEMSNLDVKGLKAFGASRMGTREGGLATEMLMRGQSLEAGKRKGGAAGAIGAQLGLHFSAEDLAGLKGMNASQAAAVLSKQLGVSDDKGFTTELESAITATSKKGGGIRGGAILARAEEQASAATKEKLKESTKGEESADNKIIQKLTDGNRFLEAIVNSSKVTQQALADINAKTKAADAETK